MILTAIAMVVVTAPPAAATKPVACYPPNYLIITNYVSDYCFANAGSLDLDIRRVDTLRSGNNEGYAVYQNKGETFWRTWAFKKHESLSTSYATVDWIMIL